MPLTEADILKCLRGLPDAGFQLTQAPSTWTNPIHLHLQTSGGERKLRLWLFQVTPGGGESDSRPPDEFRFQMSSGPRDQLDPDGYVDLSLGYEKKRDVIFGGNRIYLERYLERALEDPTSAFSPSIQIKQQHILSGKSLGFHRFTKATQLGQGETPFLAFDPKYLPAVLLNVPSAWDPGFMPDQALAALAPGMPTFATYASSKGFTFPPRLVGRYVAALASKPFVIFSGVSGTGKTKLAQLLAEFYALHSPRGSTTSSEQATTPPVGNVAVYAGAQASVDRSHIAFVSVRPDWTDSRALLGFYNPITEKYQPTETLVLLLRAHQAAQAAAAAGQPAPPFFLILDEMNLARVEHYFSDFLSCLETRKPGAGGALEQEPLVLHNQPALLIEVPKADGSGSETLQVPARLTIPLNLYVTGTVNVDETTYGFSPKVLDRAHVLEFDEVNLDTFRTPAAPTPSALVPIVPAHLPPYEAAAQTHYAALDAATHARLRHLNSLLEPARLHLGYRGAAEIALFARRYAGLLPQGLPPPEAQGEIFDAVLLQKVLPRLQGNKARLQQPLQALLDYLTAGAPVTGAAAGTGGATLAPASLETARARVQDMLDTLTAFGFVSFFK